MKAIQGQNKFDAPQWKKSMGQKSKKKKILNFPQWIKQFRTERTDEQMALPASPPVYFVSLFLEGKVVVVTAKAEASHAFTNKANSFERGKLFRIWGGNHFTAYLYSFKVVEE